MRVILVTVCLALCLAVAAPAVDFTALQADGYINDFARVIDPATRAALESYCTRVQEATGAQIAVITIDTLAGEPVEDVASAIFRKWGIGKKGKDEGVLLLLVTRDRRIRLEVGYGLEPVIPDGAAGDVLRAMRPALRESRYGEAVTEALNVIGSRIAQEKGVNIDAPLPRRTPRSQSRSPLPGMLLFVMVLVFLLMVLGGGGRGRRGGGFRGGRGGDVLAGMIIGNLLGRGFGGGGGGGGFGGFSGGGGFGGFGGGSSGGGGASSSW
ncbi:MAG TPA: TPM domain-containing protein [Bryobacteraceae bacterium]|nr:TPM domain-containing protein [Bryobacteraceae bacterium]